jgi:ribosomal protein S20
MANTKSAKKMVRKIARRTEVNKSRKSRIRTFVRKVEEAVASGDQKIAIATLSINDLLTTMSPVKPSHRRSDRIR